MISATGKSYSLFPVAFLFLVHQSLSYSGKEILKIYASDTAMAAETFTEI